MNESFIAIVQHTMRLKGFSWQYHLHNKYYYSGVTHWLRLHAPTLYYQKNLDAFLFTYMNFHGFQSSGKAVHKV